MNFNNIIYFLKWLPESARFDAASGDSDKALNTLKKIADENGKKLTIIIVIIF